MPDLLEVEVFLEKCRDHPLLDVRSPSEFTKAHIPGALSLPLFDDRERALVGTAYTQNSRQEAILLGLELSGPKLATLARQAQELAPGAAVCLHCWRGGMRSSSVAWLLELLGMQVYLLEGGYRAFRNYVLRTFSLPFSITSLGGFTGSGKTEILASLRTLGEQVIDLENIAVHLGSAFGSLGTLVQPSQEAFENDLAMKLRALDPSRRVWMEDECINLGRLQIPDPLFRQLQAAPLVRILINNAERSRFILARYGRLDPEFLSESVIKIKKRLGNEKMQAALDSIASGDLTVAVALVLEYYDKSYLKNILRRTENRMTDFAFDLIDVEHIAKQLLAQLKEIDIHE